MHRFLFLLFLIITVSVSAKEYDILVAADGSGDFVSVQKAISSVRDFRPEGRTVILLKRVFIKKNCFYLPTKPKLLLLVKTGTVRLLHGTIAPTLIKWVHSSLILF